MDKNLTSCNNTNNLSNKSQARIQGGFFSLLPEEHSTLTLYCGHCGNPRIVTLYCGDRACPFCLAKQASRLYRAYWKQIKAKPASSLLDVTLTLKNVPDGDLRGGLRRLRSSLKKLMRRKRYRSWKGGMYAIESPNEGNGWHLHFHLLIEGGYVSQKQLSKDWQEITDDSFIVWIRRVKSSVSAFSRMIEYVKKSPRLATFWHWTEYNAVFKNVRMVHLFGSWYNEFIMEKPSPVPCEACGQQAGWLSEGMVSFLNAIAVREKWAPARSPPV